MLRLDSLVKRYGDVTALDGCRLDVERGQVLGFVGPNGAGKTTAMRTVFGLAVPDTGEVTWDGRPITHDVQRRFGYMPEERGLYPRMGVADQIAYFGRLHGMPKREATRTAAALLDAFGLGDRAAAAVETLSHGNQQRVQLAVALAHSPELLILDEPFAGLDPVAAATFAEVLADRAREGAAVLFSSHQLDLVEDLCPEVVVIDRGRVVLAGPVHSLRADSPHRYLEVAVDGEPIDWAAAIPGSRIVHQAGNRTKVLVGVDIDLVDVAAIASAAGRVVEFKLSPPDLSEIFREAVST